MKKRLQKRAISPLLATLILIAFSIGLGAVVMSFGETFIESNAEFATGETEVTTVCTGIDFNIITIKGQPQICRINSGIDVFLENGPGGDIASVQATVVGADGVVVITNILKDPLRQNSGVKTLFEHDRVGNVLQVKLTPLLVQDGAPVYCSEQAIVLEDIRQC